MGCGATINRSRATGNLVCLNERCPRPHAAIEILGEQEQEHLVTFDAAGDFYNMRHPLRERLNGALMECQAAWGLVELLDADFRPDPSVTYRLVTVRKPSDGDPGEYRLDPR